MTLRACSLAVLAGLFSTAAGAQSLSGYRYTIQVHSDKKDERLASVQDAGDRARFDFSSKDGYLLILDRGRRIISVHPRDQEYSEVADTSLEKVIGRALHAVSTTGIVQFNVQQADVRTRAMGAGGTIAGRSTQHYRLTQDYTVSVRALGHEGDQVHHIVVTDYWVDSTLHLARNPFLDLLASAETALAQQSTDFQQRSTRARSSMFTGVPLRVVVTSLEDDHHGDDKSLVIDLTGLEKANLDQQAFEIPAGYRQRTGSFNLDFGRDN